MLKIIFTNIYISYKYIIMINYNDPEFDISLIILIFFLIGHIFMIHGIYNKYFFDANEFEYDYEDEYDDKVKNSPNTDSTKDERQKHTVIPYEEKYLTKVRCMINEYIFTEEELKIQEKKIKELEEDENNKKLESIYALNEKIEELNMKLREINTNQNHKINKDESILKKIHESIENEININKKQLIEIQEKTLNIDELNDQSQQYIIDEQLKEFKKKYIIEHTPLGNVLMFYNHDKLAFEYYSDLTIPYRYLETVARKYVLTYNYRPLYIDMEEELKDYEKKLEDKEAREKEKEDDEKNLDTNTKSTPKDVFAKFKSYNKEAGTGRVNTAPPPKNSIPQNRMISSVNLKDKTDGTNREKLLLKEKANRYSYQGKFLNFNILQKIDKKVVDKKYALTFADFKKMNKDKLENKN